jgi:hypothetical protein
MVRRAWRVVFAEHPPESVVVDVLSATARVARSHETIRVIVGVVRILTFGGLRRVRLETYHEPTE